MRPSKEASVVAAVGALLVVVFAIAFIYIGMHIRPKHSDTVTYTPVAHKRAKRHMYHLQDNREVYQDDAGWWYWFQTMPDLRGGNGPDTSTYWVTRASPWTDPNNKVRFEDDEEEPVDEVGAPVTEQEQQEVLQEQEAAPPAETEDKQQDMQDNEPDNSAPAPAPSEPSSDSPSDSGSSDGGGGGPD